MEDDLDFDIDVNRYLEEHREMFDFAEFEEFEIEKDEYDETNFG